MYNTTIVSAIITKINNNRNIEKYIEYGKKLMECNLPKIIFMEKETYDTYFIDNEYKNIKFIITKKEDLYLYKYTDKITNFNILEGTKEKDTLEYMFIQCNKTEWVKKAIEINYFNTEQFMWLDFGIYHMMNNDENFRDNINNLNNKEYNNVRIASCWDPNKNFLIDLYKRVAWYFAGSIFGGHYEKLLLFSKLMKQKCLQIINEKQHLMWEINIWYLIYKENPELFNCYISHHDPNIIINY